MNYIFNFEFKKSQTSGGRSSAIIPLRVAKKLLEQEML